MEKNEQSLINIFKNKNKKTCPFCNSTNLGAKGNIFTITEVKKSISKKNKKTKKEEEAKKEVVDNTAAYIICRDCGARGPYCAGDQALDISALKAEDAWNNRKTS